MKNHQTALWKTCMLLTLFLMNQTAEAQVSFGKPSLFNEGWLFSLSDHPSAKLPDFEDTEWRQLNLPHDWSSEGKLSPKNASCTGYLPAGIAWYRKHFQYVPSKDSPLSYLYFEGVYNRSEVYLNGHLLGKRPNGYISFMYELTPYLKKGENVLAVRVDHSRNADSRWYTGSGIYRDVWLVKAGEMHLSQWGTSYRLLSEENGNATVEVTSRMEHARGKSLRGLQLNVTLQDADGQTVATKKSIINVVGEQVHTDTLTVRNARLWSVKRPYLYRMKITLSKQGRLLDENEVKVGLRTLEFDADHGFALNGEWMKVKGVCLHHDAGVLGAVVPREVWRRKIGQLKEMGANAIRMSHNPQAPVVYDLCDELGMLVLDEASDEWEFPKRKWVEGWNVGTPSYDGTFDFFEEWIDRDVTDMVRRDRNHPSVFLWSIGNEVDYPNDPYSHPILDGDGASINQPMFGGYKPEQPHAERIGKIAQRLAADVRAVDISRPVTGALAGVVMSNQTAYPDAIDVVGYNYTENRYDTDHLLYPKRILYGSETGVGFDSWKAVRDKEYIFGQFIWTGTDYLGESGRWPSRGLNTGLLDFNSFKKPRGWFRASLWSPKPVTYIGTYKIPQQPRWRNALSTDAQDDWNYQEGDSIRVVCYTNAAKAHLLLNGKEIGETKAYDDHTGVISWDLLYQPGTLYAEGLDAAGNVISAYAIHTVGEAVNFRLSLLDEKQEAVGVHQVLVELLDDTGHLATQDRHDIACEVSGDGIFLGMENADNRDMSGYKNTHRSAYRGRLVVYVQRTGFGEIRLTFKAKGLKDTSLFIPSR